MTEQLVKDLTEAVKEMRRYGEELEKKYDGLMKDAQERANQAISELKDKLDATEKRLAEAETKLARPAMASLEAEAEKLTKEREARERKEAFFAACRYGIKYLKEEARKHVHVLSPAEIKAELAESARALKNAGYVQEAKALIESNDQTGGFMAPPEFDTEIRKGVVLQSSLRGLATMRQTSRRSLQFPVRTGLFSAVWASELGQHQENQGYKVSLAEVPNHEMVALLFYSLEDVEDVVYDLEGDLTASAIEQFAVLEGKSVIAGNGIGQPQGILELPNLPGFHLQKTGSATDIPADKLIDFFYTGVKEDYARNGTWLMNRKTHGFIRKIRSNTGGAGTGDYLWQPGLQAGVPDMLLGRPVVEQPDMPDIGASNYPIAFGDFRRGYLIVDRIGVKVQRLQERYIDQNLIALYIRRRVGGQIVIQEAFNLLQTAA